VNEPPKSASEVIEQLAARRADAAVTLELLDSYVQKVEAEQRDLENPQAVRDYIAFFVKFVGDAVGLIDHVVGELPQRATHEQVDALRQAASNAAVEQRRCLLFRDKCINKPLPHERLRPLLNEISVTTRDQLTAFRDLSRAAERIQQLLPAPPTAEPERAFDRRALFTRFLKRSTGDD
jgi:hypothetical protein